MHWLKLKNVWLILSSIALLSGCAKVVIKDVEWCASAGRFGALCQHSIHDQSRRMTVEEFIDFLQARPGNPANGIPAKGPALCTSSEGFKDVKTMLEQACYLLKKKCTYEMKQTIQRLELIVNEAEIVE